VECVFFRQEQGLAAALCLRYVLFLILTAGKGRVLPWEPLMCVEMNESDSQPSWRLTSHSTLGLNGKCWTKTTAMFVHCLFLGPFSRFVSLYQLCNRIYATPRLRAFFSIFFVFWEFSSSFGMCSSTPPPLPTPYCLLAIDPSVHTPGLFLDLWVSLHPSYLLPSSVRSVERHLRGLAGLARPVLDQYVDHSKP
jgi:hypothetical protein